MRAYALLCLSLVAYFSVSPVVSESPYKQYYINKYCRPGSRHETIEMDEDEAIVISSGDRYRNFLECSVSVKAEKGFGITVTVKKVDLRENVDKLTLDINDSLHPEWTGQPKPSRNGERVSYVANRKIKVRFSTGYSSQPTNYKEFILILTPYRMSDTCKTSEISCGPKRCILEQFLCDGHNNCGDNSDEILCLDGQQTSNLAIVGSAMAGLVVVLLICYCCRCFTCCCSKKRVRKDYIPFNETMDSRKTETTFTEAPSGSLEPSAPVGPNDHMSYGSAQQPFARFPMNPNYPYFIDQTVSHPSTSDMDNNYMPPPPPYTPRDPNPQ